MGSGQAPSAAPFDLLAQDFAQGKHFGLCSSFRLMVEEKATIKLRAVVIFCEVYS
jgi:hypothetical protein